HQDTGASLKAPTLIHFSNPTHTKSMAQQLQQIIDQAWEERASLSPQAAPASIKQAVAAVLAQLDAGTLRVAYKADGVWLVNQWVKKAVLLSFRLEDNRCMPAG